MNLRSVMVSAVAALTMVAGGASAGTAQAAEIPDVYGTVGFGGKLPLSTPTPISEVDVPRGTLYHGLWGEGLYVNRQTALITAVWSPLCNRTMTYELRDVDHRVVDSKTVDPGSDCTTWSQERAGTANWKKRTVPGFACALLKVGDDVIAEQCHQIAGR